MCSECVQQGLQVPADMKPNLLVEFTEFNPHKTAARSNRFSCILRYKLQLIDYNKERGDSKKLS